MNVEGSATPSAQLTGLVANTTYYVYIKATCTTSPLDESPWSKMSNANPAYTFTTPTCVTPTGLRDSAVTNSTAWLKWNNAENLQGWTVIYGTAEEFMTNTMPHTVDVAVNSVKLTGLNAYTNYMVYVRANCTATDYSELSSEITFRTTCPDGGDMVLGDVNATTTSNYLPTYHYFNYSLSEQIYTAEEIGAANTFSSIAFYVTTAKNTTRDVDIYLKETSKASFESTSDWETSSDATLVYSGNFTPSQTGWMTLNFAAPFAYSGSSNLMLIVHDKTGSYAGSPYAAYRVSAAPAANMVLYKYQDAVGIDPVNMTIAGTRINNRSVIKLGANCNTDVTCFAPKSLAAAIDSSNNVTLTWAPRTDLEPIVNDYDINYGVQGFDPDATTQNLVHVGNVTTYQFTALPLMDYDVYVRTHCSDNDHSKWTKASFTSYPSVFAPKEVTSTGRTATSVTLTWTEQNPVPATQWQVVYGAPGFDPENGQPVDAGKPFTVEGLHHTTSYDFYVRAKKGNNVSPWSAVYNTMTGCGVWQLADMPMTENFDDYEGYAYTATSGDNKLPNCWSAVNGGTTSYKNMPSVCNASSYAIAGTKSLMFYNTTAAANGQQFAVLPEFGFNLDTLEVSFKGKCYSGNTSSYVVLGVMPNAIDTAHFVAVDTVHFTTTVTDYNVSFKNYDGNGHFVAFKAPKIGTTNRFFIDDVEVKLREKTNRASDLGGEYSICNEFVMPAVDPYGHYNSNVNATYVIRPAEQGKVVELSGTYDLEYGYDFLYVYEGEGANKTIVDTLTGKGSYTFRTESSDWVNHAAVTLVYRTDADNSLQGEGFKLLARCVCPTAVADTVVTKHTANGVYTWHDQTRDNSNQPMAGAPDKEYVLEYTVANVAGCDSVFLRDSLLLHPTYEIAYTNRHICERDTFHVNNDGQGFFGKFHTATGNYRDTLQTIYGGDSIGVLSLQMHPAPTAGIYYNGRAVTTVSAFCDNADMVLNARSSDNAATYLWEDSTTDATRVVNPHVSNSYSVVATDATEWHCTSLPATLTVTTTPVALPVISATAAEICRGESTTLTVSDSSNLAGVTFKWSNNQTGSSITVTPNETTTYSVTATTESGCATTASMEITVHQLPVVEVSTSVAGICRDSVVTLNATAVEGYSYSWNTGATTASATVNPNTTAAYTVTVTDQYGCVKDFTTAAVTVYPSYEMNVEASECMNKLPYTFGTQSLSEDGLYTENFTIAHDCDSLVHLTFVVQDTAINNTYRELCYGTPFTFGEGIYQHNYTAEHTGVITYLDTTSGCPALYNLYLTVHMPAATMFDTTVCDLMTWNNEDYTATGAYNQTLATTKNCDSVVTMNLTVNYSNTGIDNQDVCDQLEWIDGNVYTEPTNVPTYMLQNQWGCDSLVTLNLTAVRHSTEGVDNITYCESFSFHWIDGNHYEYNETDGAIRFVLPGVLNAQGCDTTAILNLVMNPVRDTLPAKDTTVCDELLVRTVTCENQILDSSIRNSGYYELRVHNDATNRDEIMCLNVTINTSTPTTTYVDACLPYEWWIDADKDSTTGTNGKELLVRTIGVNDFPGQTTIIISQEIEQTANGCSGLAMLRLNARRPSINTVVVDLCENGSVRSMGQTDSVYYYGKDYVNLPVENRYVDFYRGMNAANCDTTDHLVFNILDSAEIHVYDTLYEGQFVYNETLGKYLYAWVSQTNDQDTLWIPDNHYGNDVEVDGYSVAKWQRENGCDSTVYVHYHIVPILHSQEPDTAVCSVFVWERDGRVADIATIDEAQMIIGGPYRAMAWVYDTLMSKTYEYDSVVSKRVFFWGAADTALVLDSVVCTEYEWQGVTYRTDSTFYLAAGKTKNGCDSVNAFHFTVTGSQMHDFVVVTNAPYIWGYYDANNVFQKVDNIDTAYKQSTNRYIDVTTTNGCDQVYHLNLTMLNDQFDFCGNDTLEHVIPFTNDTLVPSELYAQWGVGPLYQETHHSGEPLVTTYYDTLYFVNIRPFYNNQVFDTAVCDQFDWNGQQITDTGIYTQVLTTDYMCDSVVSYRVRVNHSAGIDSNWVVEACDSLVYHYGVTYHAPVIGDSIPAHDFTFVYDTTFKASTQFSFVLKNEKFCDSVVNMTLTVNHNTSHRDSLVACDSLLYHGVTFKTDQNNTLVPYIAENGCSSVDTLKLTVKSSVINAWDTVVNEPSYTYKGRFFQAPTNISFYDTVATAKNGCDSILDVHIIVQTGDILTVPVNACGLFTWNNMGDTVGNGHTYKWISPAESAAHGNALYLDVTDSVYIHTSENPRAYKWNADTTVLEQTSVLWLTLYEAGFGDTTIARYPISMGNTLTLGYGDSLKTVTFEIPEAQRPTWNNKNVTIDTTLFFEYTNGGYFCGNYVDVTINAVYNYDTLAADVVCYEQDSLDWNGRMIALQQGDSVKYDSTFAEGTYNVQYTTRYVTRKAFVGSDIADSVVCDQLAWGDSIYTESTTNIVKRVTKNGCDSVVTILNLTVNHPAHQSLTAVGCDSAFWAAKGANGKWYFTTTTDTIKYKDANNCLVVDTMHLTVVPTVHRVALDTTVCDSLVWHDWTFDATGKYPYYYVNTVSGISCSNTDTLNLVVNNSVETYPDSVVFGENFRMDGQLYSAPFNGTVVRNLTTTKGCDSIAHVHLTVDFYNDTNINRSACGTYTWANDDNELGNGHYYRSITDEESAAHDNALYYDVTASEYVLSNPTYTPESGQAHYGYRYHLQLTLNGAVFSEKDTTYLLSNNNASGVMTYHDTAYNFSNILAKKASRDTIVSVSFGATATACDSIQTLTVHAIYNYTSTKATVCAEQGDSITWRNKKWAIGTAGGAAVTLIDTANKGTQDMWIYTHKVTRRAAVATMANDTSVCDLFAWGTKTFTKDTTDVSMTFKNRYQCDSVVTIPVVTVRKSTIFNDTAVACDQFHWTRNDSTFKASTVFTDTIKNTVGCDSLQTLHLTINRNPGSSTTVVTCDSYTWNLSGTSMTFNADTNAYHKFKDANGCEGYDTLIASISKSSIVYDTQYYGEGSIRYNGHLYVSGDSYKYADTVWANEAHTEFVPNAVGCYNIDSITVYVGNAYHRDYMAVACNSYTWASNGHTYTYIPVAERTNGALYYDATAEDTVFINPTIRIANEGTYDSVIMLTLTLTQNVTSNDSVSYPVSLAAVTYGDSTFNYSAQRDLALRGGDFEGYNDIRDVHFSSINYCDSVVTVKIHLYNNYRAAGTADICATDMSYAWRGHEVSTVTTDFDNVHRYYIYDTIEENGQPVVEYLTVVQHPVVYATERRYACDSYDWNGEHFTQSASNFTKLFPNGSSYGCDSTVILHLTIYNTTSADSIIEVCDSYTWTAAQGNFTRTYTESIDTVVNYDNVYAYKTCQSRDSLHLVINHKSTQVANVVVCDEYHFYHEYQGVADVDTTFTTDTANYQRVMSDVHGCDSTVTLNLTVNHMSQRADTIKVTVYEPSYTGASGKVYYTTGEYKDTITNVAGCDSIEVLNLTFNHGVITNLPFICDSTKWHGVNYTEAGTYYYTNKKTHIVDTLVIGEVRQATHDVYRDTACQVYTWTRSNELMGTYVIGGPYTTGGVKTYDYTNAAGCESTDTLHLVLGSGRTFNEMIETACGSYDWTVNDSLIGTFTESIETQTSFVNPATKCDSVVFLKLTIKNAPVIDTAATICASELPYTWAGRNIVMTEAGVEELTFQLENSCDSTIRFTLTVNPTYDTAITAQVCLGNGFTGYGFEIAADELAASGTYIFDTTLATVNGCDSNVTLTLTVGDVLTSAEVVAACDNYTWNGVTYTQSGDYNITRTTPEGCTLADTLHLTINTNPGVVENQVVCESYLWTIGDEIIGTYNQTGTYTTYFTDANGCVGIGVLNLTIAPEEAIDTNAIACNSFVWYGDTLTESGVYTHSYTVTGGCTGVKTLTLTINGSTTGEETVETCDVYTWNGELYDESGDYTWNGTNANGCDSVATLHLTIKESVVVVIDTTACESFTWNNVEYTESQEIITSYTAANGCDSIEVVNLTVNMPSVEALIITACDSYIWDLNDAIYTESTVDVVTLQGAAANGCDSIVTLMLTINHAEGTVENVEVCDSYVWNGAMYTESGAYAHNFIDNNGCTGVDSLYLTIKAPAYETVIANACGYYNWHGETYTESTTATWTGTAANGCDSIVTLMVAIHQPATTTISLSSCGSYNWNGQILTASGSYIQHLETVNGCDSTVTLTLTITEPVTVTLAPVTACDSYTWNGMTYTTSQTLTTTTTGSNGCDSTTVLALTINNSQNVTLAPVSACGSYTWNGETYTTSQTLSYTTTGSNGCDSTTTVALTINNATTGDTTAVACNQFVWNGVAYAQTGEYQNVYTNVNGCDSIVTLHLTINNSADVTVNETACDSYTWSVDNQTYTTSGIYTSPVMQTVNGCDSTVTLNLTVNYSTSASVEVTAVGSFTWNGEVLDESGVYTWTGTNAAGCDSVVTLDLTITPAYFNVFIDVNDPLMGNVTNGGAQVVAAGEVITVTASPNVGYHFVDWSNGLTDATISIIVTSDTTLIANFAIDKYVINAVASDESMGTVTGSGEYTYGATVVLEARAKDGYKFVRWSTGETDAHIEFQAVESLDVIAYFSPVGIDDVEDSNVEIYSTDSKIIVKGAENKDVYVYDVNGRCVRRQANATETLEFTMSTTGVYLVKVGDAPAKRVVVVR